MRIVRATKKLLRLTGPSTAPDTLLGLWYATSKARPAAGDSGGRRCADGIAEFEALLAR